MIVMLSGGPYSHEVFEDVPDDKSELEVDIKYKNLNGPDRGPGKAFYKDYGHVKYFAGIELHLFSFVNN